MKDPASLMIRQSLEINELNKLMIRQSLEINELNKLMIHKSVKIEELKMELTKISEDRLQRENEIINEVGALKSKSSKFEQVNNDLIANQTENIKILRGIEGLLHGMRQSRALNLMALVAPSARRDVESIFRNFSKLNFPE